MRRCAADSLALCDTQRRNLAESRYSAARNAGELLGALVASLRVSSLPDIQRNAESLTVAICQLEIDAGERDKAARESKARAESLAASLRECERAEVACNAERESLAARNATQGITIQTYREQRDAEGERANKAEALAASRLAEAVQYRQWEASALELVAKREAERDAALRQLAEYRSLMSALPAGAALAYPAAFALLRAYLADVESDK